MKRYRLLLLLGLVFIPAIVLPQEEIDPYALEDSLAINIDIFELEYPAEMTLKYDMKEFNKRQSEDKYLKAELRYHMGEGIQDRVHTVRIKSRGKNRKEVCSFPPIWINIRKADIKNVRLQDINRIKLVTHCGGSNTYESYVFKEFLVYKIYSLLSPYSFRVRLVKMKYIDTSRKKERHTDTWGFLIEPEEMFAERMEMLPYKNDRVSLRFADPASTDRMAMFQYMIGNSDYSVIGRHNVKLFRSREVSEKRIIPVPYDFDYCGLVDAHYAIPGDKLGISSVRDRYYLGACRPSEDYKKNIEELQSLKNEIFEIITSFEYLGEKEKASAITYLDEFFKASLKERFIDNSILSTCRE